MCEKSPPLSPRQTRGQAQRQAAAKKATQPSPYTIHSGSLPSPPQARQLGPQNLPAHFIRTRPRVQSVMTSPPHYPQSDEGEDESSYGSGEEEYSAGAQSKEGSESAFGMIVRFYSIQRHLSLIRVLMQFKLLRKFLLHLRVLKIFFLQHLLPRSQSPHSLHSPTCLAYFEMVF